jgi:hypothetical protein
MPSRRTVQPLPQPRVRSTEMEGFWEFFWFIFVCFACVAYLSLLFFIIRP